MSQISVWHVKFHLEASAGRVTSGPYSTFIGISGGSRGDQQTVNTAASIKTAVSNNLASILSAMGAGTGAPGGTVVIDEHTHASGPDCWT
ncbi:MAG TPA: hypothetical protein VJ999_11445 [Candidatus Sulfotelmatobacter sp.]|nr:hypothetical protein [Candidatus Sulfotelmatobacter sp.]